MQGSMRTRLFSPCTAASLLMIIFLLAGEVHLTRVRSPRNVFADLMPQGRTLPESCGYFYSRSKFVDATCNISQAVKHAAAAAAAGGCVPATAARKGCPRRPAVLLTHTWIHIFDFDDDASMRKLSLLIRAWMLTQDLRRSRFHVWASIVLPERQNASLIPWFDQFAPYVSLRLFDYDAEIAKTPLSLSKHFSTWKRFNSSTHNILALQSDVFRNVVLYNHGGLWLDTDSVPLRDLWDITAGLGLQFIPKFAGFIANGHVLYANCPKSALSRRRLEHIIMFPRDHVDSWPREPSSGGHSWIFNDALSEHVRASQALKYNLSQDGEEINYSELPDSAWEDIEIPFPLNWFDNWWSCNGLTKRNTTEFLETTACNGAYIWHRLSKHVKDDPNVWGPYSGGNQFWDEIYGEPTHDHTKLRQKWPEQPMILKGGVDC